MRFSMRRAFSLLLLLSSASSKQNRISQRQSADGVDHERSVLLLGAAGGLGDLQLDLVRDAHAGGALGLDETLLGLRLLLLALAPLLALAALLVGPSSKVVALEALVLGGHPLVQLRKPVSHLNLVIVVQVDLGPVELQLLFFGRCGALRRDVMMPDE